MKIINLKAENIKRLKAVEIKPDKNTVVISGKNGQGKSSVLDAILFALGGKDALKNTPKPVRAGEESGRIEIDLGDYRVVRTFTSKGTTRVELFSSENAKFASPQTMLDEMVGRIAFDPLEFAKMKPAEQRLVLIEVLGIADQVEKLEYEYKSKYELRTFVGRELRSAQGHLDSIEKPVGAPSKPVETAKLMAQLKEAEERNRQVDYAGEMLEETEIKLESAEKELAELQQRITALKKEKKQWGKQLNSMDYVKTSELEEQIASADADNQKYRDQQDYVEAQNEVQKKKSEQEKLTQKLQGIVEQKNELINTAKLPIEGLNIDSDGVTFEGIPFTQLSSAEQLKVSLAIAMAMNPRLRVMRIMDGSLLDSDNLEVINQMAQDHDYQVWIEKVDDSGQVGVVIENGEIKK